MKSRTLLSIVIAAALLFAACGPDADVSTTTEIAAAEITTTTPTTTVAPVAEGEPFEILREEDIVYHSDDDGTWTMDVLYPDTGGPWPLVIVYHGIPAGPAVNEARRIAERGAVAVAPQWVKVFPPEMTREVYIDGILFDRAACAVHEAQQIAREYGADPANTTVAGFSAGMHPTGWIGLGIVRNDLCRTPLAHQPVGVVMGDSQFLFYEEGWDDSFADPDSPATDTLDRFVNPERWDVPDDLAVYLWTSNHRYERDIESPPTTNSWIWERDTTGTLVDDLTTLGAFEDEWIGWMDNGLLMEMRLKAAGVDALHEAVGGNHSYSNAVFDAIAALITAKR